ncbi:uncharacterized protein B0J16DRAFT_385556 [Fusarium flagelliforme]|uniref:Uncharacterized protein n=1 Tax=Fusarium flagelliforme TaxID=2675880 RepID=A0A395MSI9_9HYPO|nr:uncharacterized protein B0J16DRAFT_385556 [Fusarium flagelliforme]KAH7182483.1 hypothetical protein B0J16DRAFT_385556 [Fusarium flagelliforme]RFN50545.1 hypothetical protein FIE12Z_5171 [Fusarium flagelliforme]
MPPHSTGHDYAAPAPYAKYEHRMRYPKRAQSAASPRHNSRSLPPGVLPPGSPPPGAINPPEEFVPSHYINEFRKHEAINPPRVPKTVVTEPYVDHHEKMKYPKPAPPAAMPRPDNLWGGCKKPGGCNKPAADKSPPVPTMMNPSEAPPPFKDGELVSGQDGSIYPYNHANSMANKAFWSKWMWPIACCPVLPFLCILLCTGASIGSKNMKKKNGDEEECEDEDEDEE